jgi:hypothetical protein
MAGVTYDDVLVSYNSNSVTYDDLGNAETCIVDQADSLANYGELLQAGAKSMSPRPYEAGLLNVFNSSAVWTLKLPGGHTRFVTVEVGSMVITPVHGVYMAELTLTDVTPPSNDPYNGS